MMVETLHPHHLPGSPSLPASDILRLLSFNIQAGIETRHFRHYLTRGALQHWLPLGRKRENLDRIAHVIQSFDVVALQEVDGGSLRSGFLNQLEYLAVRCQFPYWAQQCNRNLGPLGQHGNGLLSRLSPLRVEEHRLPGPIPGRGALAVWLGERSNPLLVVNLHLALGPRTRLRQLDYVGRLIAQHEHVVVMGDMNTHADQLLSHPALRDSNLYSPDLGSKTYPAWRPVRSLDHILLSPGLSVRSVEVLPAAHSDHLPLAVEIALPMALR